MQSPALPRNSNGRLDFPGPTQEETCIPRCNSRILPQLEKKHVGPPSALDEALAHYSVSREDPGSVLNCETVLGTLDATRKVTRLTSFTQGEHRGSRHHLICAPSPLLIETGGSIPLLCLQGVPVAETSSSQCRRAKVGSLVRELDPVCCN